jgi:hypothetical protein
MPCPCGCPSPVKAGNTYATRVCWLRLTATVRGQRGGLASGATRRKSGAKRIAFQVAVHSCQTKEAAYQVGFSRGYNSGWAMGKRAALREARKVAAA